MGVSSKPSLAFGQTDPCIQPGGEISWKFVEKNATLSDQGPSQDRMTGSRWGEGRRKATLLTVWCAPLSLGVIHGITAMARQSREREEMRKGNWNLCRKCLELDASLNHLCQSQDSEMKPPVVRSEVLCCAFSTLCWRMTEHCIGHSESSSQVVPRLGITI